jgi:RNA 2',3'-cyclic 3'-phosphodiesterase
MPANRSTTAPTDRAARMRLFVAVWPDEPTRRLLGALELELGRARGLRFVGPARWHVTLRFLGDVDEEAVGTLGDALVACAAAFPGPLECRLGPGTAWFTEVRVLQLPAAGLDGLAGAVRAAMAPFAPRSEDAEPPFNGHLTIARSKGRRLGVAALGEMAGIPFEAAFAVRTVDLVRSQASPEGHAYSTLVRAPLGGVTTQRPGGRSGSP